MERSPKRSVDKDTNDIFDFIFQNSMGNPIIFTEAPSLAQMKANTWGVFGQTIYIKFANSVVLSFSGTEVS